MRLNEKKPSKSVKKGRASKLAWATPCAVGVMVAAAGGCAGADAGEDDVRVRASATTLGERAGGNPLELAPMPPPGQSVIFTDTEGRRWAVRQITEFSSDTQEPPSKAASKGAPYGRPIAELAADLRAIRLKVTPAGVWEYEELDPPVARVAAARAKTLNKVWGYGRVRPDGTAEYVEETSPLTPISGDVDPGMVSRLDDFGPHLRASAGRRTLRTDVRGGFPEVGGMSGLLAPPSLLPLTASGIEPSSRLSPGPTNARTILPSPDYDERTWVSHSEIDSSQGKVEILLTSQPWPSGLRCSAHLIGRSTALSAAHCFWPYFGSNWGPALAWAVGVVRTEHQTAGYAETIKYGPWNGCYWVNVPAAWKYGNRDTWNDFAAIDFQLTGCGISLPGDVVGWTSFMVGATNAAHVAAPTSLNGYDSADPLPPQPPGLLTYLAPSLVTRSKTAWSTSIVPGTNDTVLSTIVDLAGGGSGSCLMQPVNPYTTSHVCVGPMVSGDASANYARHLDNEIWSFVQANSMEW